MIDAHQHFWRIGENDCVWPTADLTEIYRNFNPEDLQIETDKAGITGTVLVQSQESDQDTDYLLSLAENSNLIKAVVGWVDLLSPRAPARLEQLAGHPKMRGVRPMLQGMADDTWILKPELEPAINVLKKKSLVFDALIFTRHLPFLHIFARRHQQLSIVIDHAAKPAINAGGFGPWAASMSAMAELPNVVCKLSGLLTESAAEQGVDQLRPYIVHLYREFGADRLLWGSDWPVLLLAKNQKLNNYEAWLNLAKHLLPVASADELDLVFEGNAKRIYQI